MVMSERECPLGLNEEACASIASSQPKYINSVPKFTATRSLPQRCVLPPAQPPAAADADADASASNSPRMAQVQGSPPWSDLPPELLGLVFLRLPKRADRAFFTAVCRAWCSAARQCHLPSPSPVPWLVVPDGRVTNFLHGETFQLPDDVRYHSSCGEWLLLSRHDSSCFLMNHFTKATMPLPSLSSYSYYQEAVDVDGDIVPEMPWTWMNNEVIREDEISVLSLVVCSTHLIAAILADGYLRTIALCRPGAAAWSVSAHVHCLWLSDMVFFQGKLYAFVKSTVSHEDFIAINIADGNNIDEPRVSRIECLIEGYVPPWNVHYLVESYGRLLMVRREHSRKSHRGSNKCQVFEADFEQRLWAEVRTLGNSQALFIGQRYSRAVHVSPYDISRDCVFFVDDSPSWIVKQTTESCGVYDMKDEKVYSTLPLVSWKSGELPATWIFSQGGDR